jgi:hypothetical protein
MEIMSMHLLPEVPTQSGSLLGSFLDIKQMNKATFETAPRRVDFAISSEILVQFKFCMILGKFIFTSIFIVDIKNKC